MSNAQITPQSAASFDQQPNVPLKIVIPRAVAADLRRGVRRVIAQVVAPQTKPDVIVILQRSAELAFAAVEGYAEAYGIELPSRIKIYLGKQLAERAPLDRFPTLHELCFSSDPQDERYAAYCDYAAWLLQEPEAHSMVEQLQAGTPDHAGGMPMKVLIVDDTAYTGVTLQVAARILAEKAYGPAAEITTLVLCEKEIEWIEGGTTATGQMIAGEWTPYGQVEIPGIMSANWPIWDDLFGRVEESEVQADFYTAATRFMKALLLGHDYGYDAEDRLILVPAAGEAAIIELAEAYAEEFELPTFLSDFCRSVNLRERQLVEIHPRTVAALRALGARTRLPTNQ